jgi:SNF family Na+-dependent transporter
LAGFVVFIYIGSLANTTGLSVDKVVQSGQGLIYVVYPFAVTTISGSAFWSVLFFLMIIALGIGSMMAGIQTLTSALNDLFNFKNSPKMNMLVLAIVCFVNFLFSTLLCTSAGTYWVEFFDQYISNWSIFVIALIECVSVGWFYGANKFKIDALAMIPEEDKRSRKLNQNAFYWWEICWRFTTPLCLAVNNL